MSNDEPLIVTEYVGEDNNILLITLNRPKSLNSLNEELLTVLEETYTNLSTDTNVRAVILVGEGKAFCSGADLKWMSKLNSANCKELIEYGQKVFSLIEDTFCPTIAVINGYAFGGGLELALSCDIRICSEDAVMSLPEVTLGLIPGWGGTYRLQRIVGEGVSKNLILTGRKITANEAQRLLLVSDVCSQERLLPRAIEMAEIIANNAPIAVKKAKQTINKNRFISREEAYKNEIEAIEDCFTTEDLNEGITALFEKRNPDFKNV